MIRGVAYYAAGFGVAVLLGLICTELARRLAIRFKVLDRPENRKIHSQPVPYLGGLGMYFAFLIYALLGSVVFPRFFHGYSVPNWLEPGLISATLLVATGVWDDVKGLSAWTKLPIQIAAMLFVTMMSDLQMAKIAHPFGGFIEFGPLAIVATVIWGVVLINAINLIDGLDGLAAGVVAISCVFLFIQGLVMGQPGMLLLGLIGVCIGFLYFNFAPARIFMGDAGSMLLGFLLAMFSLQVRVKGTMIVTLIFPLMALGIPVLDTSFAFLRRLSQGKHPFQGDARHIHHRFLALGLSARQVVLVIYFLCIAFGLFAMVMTKLTPAYRLLTILLLVLLILFFILALNHLEKHLLQILDEVKVYKSWYEYQLFDGSHREAEAGTCDVGEAEAGSGNGRRAYAAPTIARGLMDRLMRSEEQRTENVVILAKDGWSERLAEVTRRLGHRVMCLGNVDEAEKMIRDGAAGALIAEQSMAGSRLAELLMNVRLNNPKATVLVLTGASESPQSLALLQLGAYALLPACATDEVLEVIIHNAMEARFQNRRLDFLKVLFWLLIFSIPLWIVIGRFITLGKFH